ncbi:MAG: T9SS type A sorting domain-containing protein [Chitinophagales bacterium]|jgi:hypothetical protein|nr:T9SS type A sorting domain-containing protein [Chitinophagales bacterium]
MLTQINHITSFLRIAFLALVLGIVFFLSSFQSPTPDDSYVKVFPTQVKTTLYFISEIPVYKIELYNLLGNIVYSQDNSSNIDMSLMPPGFYLVKYYTPYGEHIKRIQKM